MQVIHERCAALDGHKKDSGDDHHDHPSRRSRWLADEARATAYARQA